MLILIIVLLLLFSGGWYGNGRWYNTAATPGPGTGFNPFNLIWLLLIIILIIWLVQETGLFSRLRL